MPDIERIVAEMPKAENPHTEITAFVIFGAGVGAECQFLAEQGYRKVLSEEKLGFLLYEVLGLEHVFAEDVKELRQKLLEGEE